tara:strand:- start:372 stop:821 length:450 start_codon:yes stop_codon:yes gene_type:complete
MKIVNNNFKNNNSFQIILIVLLVVYFLSNVKTPNYLEPIINNVYMYSSIVIIFIVMFLYKQYVLGIVLITFVLLLLFRLDNKPNISVSSNIKHSSQKSKNNNLKKMNVNLEKKTLEEEVINSVSLKPDNIPNPSSYHPVLCSSHDADEL